MINERNVLRQLSGFNFICGFYESMQDQDNLYLLLEYIPGGELLNHLKERLTLTVDHARFYLAEVVCVLETLH